MTKKTLFIIFSLFFLLSLLYYLVTTQIGNRNDSSIADSLSLEQKRIIKTYIFPFKYIKTLEKQNKEYKLIIEKQNTQISETVKRFNKVDKFVFPFALRGELDFKSSLENIKTDLSIIALPNNLEMQNYQILNGFFAGINNHFPGSGYIDFHKENLILLSSRGIIAYSDTNSNELLFKQIKNNIDQFINIEHFLKPSWNFYEEDFMPMNWFSLKNLAIIENKIFVSFTEEIRENCWNTSLLIADFNYENLKFKKLFSPDNCIHETKNIDNSFHARQSGGAITAFNENTILFSIGDYRERYLAQNKNSINGKIIKINIINSDYEIVSMGHRNPQGLYFDKESNIILETEHGPHGGDEINLLNIVNLNREDVLNYGWPLSSYGNHYHPEKISKSKNYHLYKSHTKYGFIEPLKYFVPSIGISSITKISNNKYLFGSMNNKTLYLIELDNLKKITKIDKIRIGERIRDLKYKNENVYLFLEDSPSIGVININRLID